MLYDNNAIIRCFVNWFPRPLRNASSNHIWTKDVKLVDNNVILGKVNGKIIYYRKDNVHDIHNAITWSRFCSSTGAKLDVYNEYFVKMKEGDIRVLYCNGTTIIDKDLDILVALEKERKVLINHKLFTNPNDLLYKKIITKWLPDILQEHGDVQFLNDSYKLEPVTIRDVAKNINDLNAKIYEGINFTE